MGNPLNGFIYSHKAIRAELDALEALASGLDAMGESEVARFADRIAFFQTVMKGHSDGEEAVWWPALDAKAPQVSTPYTLDHRAKETVFESIDGLLADFRTARSGERACLTRRLSRQVVALNVTLSHHSQKEDAHLVPLLQEHFTVAELGALSGRFVGYLPRELLPRILPWVIRALSADEQEDYLRIVKAAVPPPLFPTMAGWAKAGIPADDWAELARRIPELVAVPG